VRLRIVPLMVARGAQRTHPCSPDTPLADSRSNDLWPLAMRCAVYRGHAVVVTPPSSFGSSAEGYVLDVRREEKRSSEGCGT
jgi:hypothetical protein